MVLIHGGGGTAYPKYAKRWIDQGFAVIMLDWYNRRPVPPADGGKTRTVPLDGGVRQDHVANVANMILSHTVLRTQKNVNKDKTIFVGLSWGSWYGTMLASMDHRFQGGVMIYCGDRKQHKKIYKFPQEHSIDTKTDKHKKINKFGK